jgi:ribosomal protein L12E/L44/L45/RPP1/RPP2
MALAGNIKGKMTEDKFPAFNIDLKVKDGNFQYPDLSTPVNNVNADLQVSNNTGLIDNTVINLKNIHVELGKEPIDGKMIVTNIETGPVVDLKLKGKIDLANLKTALDLKDFNKLEGIIISDFEAKGNIASTSKNYENINAKGNISVSNIVFKGTENDQEIKVSSASLNFTPNNINLNNISMKIGESDISANGSLNNLISYALSDGILVGRLNMSSKYFDFNPYLVAEEAGKENETQKETRTAFDIPKNINFSMQSNFDKLIYDNLELKNVSGQILFKESKVILENLNMKLLDGSLTGNGYYAKTEYQEKPDIQFKLGIKDFNVKKTYDKFASVKQFAPIAKYIDGSFSSNLKMRTSLDNTLTPVWETFFSNGSLNLKSAEIKNFKPFTKLGSVLSLQELSNPKVQNVNPSFEIRNGRFYVEPVKFKIANYNVEFGGSNGIDQSLDYVMNIEIPASNLKNQANKSISSLVGKDLNLITASSVNVKALIGGTVDSPKINTSASDVAKDVTSNVVEQVKTQVIDQAKAKADSIKSAAEKKLKEEAKKKEEELQKKLEEEAKKKLKNIFGFG